MDTKDCFASLYFTYFLTFCWFCSMSTSSVVWEIVLHLHLFLSSVLPFSWIAMLILLFLSPLDSIWNYLIWCWVSLLVSIAIWLDNFILFYPTLYLLISLYFWFLVTSLLVSSFNLRVVYGMLRLLFSSCHVHEWLWWYSVPVRASI